MGRFTAGTRGWFCLRGAQAPGTNLFGLCPSLCLSPVPPPVPRPSAHPPSLCLSLCFLFFSLPSQYVAGGAKAAVSQVRRCGCLTQGHNISGQGNKQLSVPSFTATRIAHISPDASTSA